MLPSKSGQFLLFQLSTFWGAYQSEGTTKESAIVPYPGRPLYQGAANMNPRDIERIQRAVKATVTRRFDAETAQKVRAYQTRQGLDVDGVVGPRTWNRMF